MSITGEARSEQYQRRDPSSEVLDGVLLAHLETVLAPIAVDPSSPSLPAHVERELRTPITCGSLAHGFSRFACVAEILVPCSCKGRGFCPSCGGRRMAESAAHLVDHAFPDVPACQWVISFPWRMRYLFALDSRLCQFRPQSTQAARHESGFMNGDGPLESGALRDRGGELVLAIHRFGGST